MSYGTILLDPYGKNLVVYGISLTGTGKELAKRPYAPGQHGANQRRKISEYGLQQQEKQKLRFMYGLNERQFRNLFDEAGKMKGVHGENFMILLESRLRQPCLSSWLCTYSSPSTSACKPWSYYC